MSDACGDTGEGATAVEFQVELAFEGVEDLFDQLSDRFEQVLAGAWWAVAVGGAQ